VDNRVNVTDKIRQETMTAYNDNLASRHLDGKQNEMKPILLRTKEAAELLAISPRKLWELTDCGEIPCLRIGRAVRYAVEDLQQWVRTQTNSHEAATRTQAS